jgi:DNA-binding NtrC family response regulator
MPPPDRETLIKTGVATSLTPGRTFARGWHCRISSGEDVGRTVAVGLGPLVIGADADCDLVLDDPAVSRRHAEIQITARGVKVRDLGSTNGTFQGTSRITEIVVSASTTIRVGDTSLLLAPVALPSVTPSKRNRFGGLIGESLPMREVFAIMELASPTDATVLLEGESGTGKELAAQAIHDHSARSSRPFVVVDCSATHEHLVESQIFGHVRGAFTGAAGDRRGAFVEADGGSIFLDEVSELPLTSQAKLLRALEARTVQPLGSDRPVGVDTRVIAATNRDLLGMVEDGKFRFDLFHRIAVVFIRLPPLRERLEDLPVLIRHFYEGRGLAPGDVSGANLEHLREHDWAGNVRELRNVLERGWVLAGSESAGFAGLRLDLRAGGQAVCEVVDTGLPFKQAKERWNEAFERRYLAAVYRACDKNISRAARHAGINRHHFRKLLLKHDLMEEK